MADWTFAFKSSKKKGTSKDIPESEETERTNITEQVLLHFWKEKARQGSALENSNSHLEVCSADTLGQSIFTCSPDNSRLSFRDPDTESPVSFRTRADQATLTTPDNKTSDS